MSAKGANWERQLKKLLQEKGYFVIRAAGSGVDSVSPDLLALSSTKKMAFECKAWESGYIWIERWKIEKMRQFESHTGIPYYIAWKVAREEWRFFPLAALRETEKAFVLEEKDLRSGMELNRIIG